MGISAFVRLIHCFSGLASVFVWLCDLLSSYVIVFMYLYTEGGICAR